jgi:hypothetical protein
MSDERLLLARARRAEGLYRSAAVEADLLGDELAELQDAVEWARACALAVLRGTATDPARAALEAWALGFTPAWPEEVAE